MPSVIFSDSYFVTGIGQSSQNVRVNYSESYNDSSNVSTIKVTSIEIAASRFLGSCVIRGDLYINGTLMVSMPSTTSSYQASISGSMSYAVISGSSGGSVTVTHNAEGAASMMVELRNGEQSVFGAAYGGHMFGIRTTANKSVSLTTHPRASAIASSSSSVATQGTYSLTMSRKASTYYHIATFKYNNSTTLYTSGRFDTQLDFVVPRTWFNDYSSIASLPVTVSVQTYNSSGTAIGSPATASLTVNADADMKPVVSSGWVSLAPFNTGAVAGITGYVKSYSQAEATFDNTKVDMSNAVGASIASFSVTCQGETDNYTPYLTPVLASTSVSVVCTVTDTRGRTASETFTLTVMDYAKPVLTGIAIFRCNAQGTEAEDGTHYSAKATLTYASLNGQNVPTLTSAAAASGGGYGAEETLTSGTVHISTAQLSADITYTVRISATDSLGNTAVYYQVLPTRKWAMKFRPTGNGVAFGKAAEYNNTFEIAEDWDFRVHGKEINTLMQDQILSLVYPVGSIYMSVNSTSPATIFGGTWEQLEDTFLLAAGANYAAGSTGGEATHTLTDAELPATSGSFKMREMSWGTGASQYSSIAWGASGKMSTTLTGTSGADSVAYYSGVTRGYTTVGFSFGSGSGHNNMPPYLAVYMWKRTG